jgi:hypothetical protein
MKNLSIVLLIALLITSCNERKQNLTKSEPIIANKIMGTWKLVYGSVKENDSLTIKDISKSDFVKIINESHFAYFNQAYNEPRNFYGAGGTYTLKNNTYTEKLTYTAWDDYRDRNFPFTVKISKDSLIQFGIEEIKEKNIKRYVIEKYIRIK